MSLEQEAARGARVKVWITWAVILIGSLALLAELVLVFASAVLRNMGVALPGTIEIVEVIIAVIASMAILMTTLAGRHAIIRLVIDRVRRGSHRLLNAFTHLCGAFYWGLLAVGTAWIIAEVWGKQEATMLVEIPVVPFRLVFLAACISILVLLLVRAFADLRPGRDR
jgi:TRAP-type transport system small permease protein